MHRTTASWTNIQVGGIDYAYELRRLITSDEWEIRLIRVSDKKFARLVVDTKLSLQAYIDQLIEHLDRSET